MKSDAADAFTMIQQSIGAEQEWTTFEQQFTQVHPEFIEALMERAPELLAQEPSIERVDVLATNLA